MQPTMLAVRLLSAADYDAIIGVWQAAALTVRHTGRDSRERFAQQQANGQVTLGAYADDQLVGVALVTQDGRKGWINRLAVLPTFQRRGVGMALIQAAEAHLRGLGLEIHAALIEHHNTASLALFQKAGYRVEPIYYVTKRDHPDA